MSKTQLPKNEKFGYDIGALDSYLSQAVCIVADPETFGPGRHTSAAVCQKEL